jgi:sulfiredoxin
MEISATREEPHLPVKRRATLEPSRVEALAQSILAEGLKNPILARPHGTAA